MDDARRKIERMLICIGALAAALKQNHDIALMMLTMAVLWVGDRP